MNPLTWSSLQPFGGLTSDIQVHVGFAQNAHGLDLEWHVQGDLHLIQWSTQAERENLWEQTCFEAFFQTTEHISYYELNISPQKDWKLYRFSGYRSGRCSVSNVSPSLHVEQTPERFLLQAQFSGNWPLVKQNALTAILYLGESPTYWAHAHSQGRPDFHAPFPRQ
jgi:hypothetical protein